MGTEETYLTQQKQTCISKLKIIITQNTVCKKKTKIVRLFLQSQTHKEQQQYSLCLLDKYFTTTTINNNNNSIIIITRITSIL